MPELDDETIDKQIDLLFEAVEKEKYVHSRSKDTFDALAGLWFLDDTFQRSLARIASGYIVSSFLLKSLGAIYERIRMDYDLPKLNAKEFGTENVREDFIQKTRQVLQDESCMQWLKYRLMPECIQLLDSIGARVNTLEDISSLGNLADSIEYTTEQYASQNDGDLWIYDSIFRFSDQLLGGSASSVSSVSVPDLFENTFGAAHNSIYVNQVGIGDSAKDFKDFNQRIAA